jgi:hypothetical protein
MNVSPHLLLFFKMQKLFRFSLLTSTNLSYFYVHEQEEFGLDVKVIQKHFQNNFYFVIKLINFIRFMTKEMTFVSLFSFLFSLFSFLFSLFSFLFSLFSFLFSLFSFLFSLFSFASHSFPALMISLSHLT